MWKSFTKVLLFVALFTATPSPLHATGDFGPANWLHHGGDAVNHPPEFYWADELRRLAREFQPKEKRVGGDVAAGDSAPVPTESYVKEAEANDKADFENALKTGRLKANADEAKRLHAEARELINSIDDSGTAPVPALPAEPAGEFADYHKGAHAFKQGQKHWDEASTAWEALMQRPKEERHYRSTWAAFMLGKVALFQKKPEAVKWFQLVRQLAGEGFADSLGLAADSYGWEAKAELDAGNFEKSARLYLTQLALGDESAIISLKALVPDRAIVWGMMNFDPAGPDAPEQPVTPALIKKHREALVRSARDDVLRRLQTAHVLATETVGSEWMWGVQSFTGETKEDRLSNWLDALKKAGVTKSADADRLAWCAYTKGSYASAANWLKLCETDSSMSVWLRVKLLRRDGKLKQAQDLMTRVPALLEAENLRPEKDEDDSYSPNRSLWMSAHGDLASLYLSNGQFIDAMNTFFAGGLRTDALFVAERVLTSDELIAFAKSLGADDKRRAVTQVLGPRLVREDRYDEARAWFDESKQKDLETYTALLKQANDETLSKMERAKAWFDAADFLADSGELINPTFMPDAPRAEGDNPKKPKPQSLPQDRQAGFYWHTRYTNAGEKYEKLPLALPPSDAEKKRLAASKPSPDRFRHAIFVAAAMVRKAAALLPDNTDELADILNTAGNWLKGDYYGDDDEADKFFQLIERRASKTALGKEAAAKHWFVDRTGPWSK